MTKAVAILAGMSLMAASHAIITQWDFNAGGDANTGTGTTTPSIGLGTASLVGGVTATFASGDASGGSTDPNVGDDSAWNLTTWAAQGLDSGNRGAQFSVSTLGYQNIIVCWDNRHSNTSSRWVQLQYTLDGSAWQSTGLASDGLYSATAGDAWFNNRTADLSAIAGVANNPSFGFRVVAVFDPTLGNAYSTSNPTSTYGTAGTIRFDMVTVKGDLVPEPSAIAAMAIGIGALAARARSRKA